MATRLTGVIRKTFLWLMIMPLVQVFNVGGVDYIIKPFEPEEVLARVKTHLHIRELTGRAKGA